MLVSHLPICVAALLALAEPASMPGDVVIQTYDVADLVTKRRHFPAPRLGLSGLENRDPSDSDPSPDDGSTSSVDELISVIKATIAPESWEPEGPNRIVAHGTTIVVTCADETQRQISEVLLGKAVPEYHVAWKILDLGEDKLKQLGFRNGTRDVQVLDASTTKTQLERWVANGSAKKIDTPQLTVFEAQTAHAVVVEQAAFVEDVRVKNGVADPVVGTLSTGIVLEVNVRRYPHGEGIVFRWNATVADAGEATTVAAAGDISLELPHVTKSSSEGRAHLKPGQIVLVRGLLSPRIEGEGLLVFEVTRRDRH